MIEEEQLKGSYSETEAQAVYQKLKTDKAILDFAQKFMHADDQKITRNAFWTLTKATDEELSSLKTIRNELTDLVLQTDSTSIRRLTMNLIVRLDMKEDDLRTDLLDFCFDHMMDVEELPGIQSLCMKQAFRMCQFYPELMEELKRTLEGMEIDYYKPAVKCVRNRILSV